MFQYNNYAYSSGVPSSQNVAAYSTRQSAAAAAAAAHSPFTGTILAADDAGPRPFDGAAAGERDLRITSKTKHAIKHKTSPARLAQLLHPSLAFCFSFQPMTAYRPVLDGTPSLAAS